MAPEQTSLSDQEIFSAAARELRNYANTLLNMGCASDHHVSQVTRLALVLAKKANLHINEVLP